MVLESVIHSGPVTALYLGDNYILAGIGSFLHVYCQDEEGNWTLTNISEVLPGRVIHRIRKENEESSLFVIFGQKSLRLIVYDCEHKSVKIVQKLIEFSDWIWDVTWVQDKPGELCLALGHNVVLTFNIATGKSVQTVSCSEKCILYCAKFVSHNSDSLVLAAGTVFNQVVLWSPVYDSACDGRVPVDPFHRLTGHQGVIFSIDYNARLQKLCSASDDRSLRLYKLDFPGDQSSPSKADWANMKSSLLHVLFGHQARVWDVRLLSGMLISVGEDATCCVWSYEGEVIQKFKGHRGKSIWSIAAAAHEDRVATGGGDHSIRLWRLNTEQKSSRLSSRDVDFRMRPDDFPRNTMLLDFNKILTITNAGDIIMYNCCTTEVTCLMSDAAFSSYTVMTVSKVKQFIVVGNIHGVIRILHVGPEAGKPLNNLSLDKKIYGGKVFSIHFITDDTIITTGPNGLITIMQIHLFDGHLSVTLLHQMELPASRHRWVTTASFLHGGSHVVCGDRTGSIFLYKLATFDEMSKLVQKFPKIHGKAGVTHLCWHDDMLYTCGRDGLYRVFTWKNNADDDDDDDNGDEGNILICQNSNRVFKGFEWLENMVFTPEGDTLMWGFHTNLFLIWSMNQNQSVLEIDCGGGHRSWDYMSSGNKGQFVYIKTREVKVIDVTVRSNQTVVKSSVHGREIGDVKHLFSSQDSNGSSVDVMITCSEDTTLNVMLAKYTNGIPELSILHTLSGHISSVRCIAACTTSHPRSKLVISGGGRAQIRIWRVYVKTSDPGTTLRQTNPKSCGSDDLCNKPTEEDGINGFKSELQTNIGDQFHNFDGDAERKKCDVNVTSQKLIRNDNVNAITNEESTAGSLKSSQSVVWKETDTHTSDAQTSSQFAHQTKQVTSDANNIVRKDSAYLPETVKNDFNLEKGYVTLGGIHLGKAGRRSKKPWLYPADNSDPETRILDLCLFHGREISDVMVETLYFFAAACSDGLLRLFAFEEHSREITLISSSKYHDHCILKTSYISIPYRHDHTSKTNPVANAALDHSINQTTDSNGCQEDNLLSGETCDNLIFDKLNQIVLLSAATDGKVAFYNISNLCYKYAIDNEYTKTGCGNSSQRGGNMSVPLEDGNEMSPLFCLQLHQSGVNSLHCQHIAASMYTVITGGDDNALTVSYINVEHGCLDNTLHIDLVKEGRCINAHSAQVTGVWWLGMSLILSVSIDQRLCLWRVQETKLSLEISMADCKVVDVSDASNIDVFTNSEGQFVVISGEGLQLFRIHRPDSKLLLEDSITKHRQLVL